LTVGAVHILSPRASLYQKPELNIIRPHRSIS